MPAQAPAGNPSSAQIYMQIKANGQDVEGNSADTKNHDKWCDVLAFEYELARSTDANTGMSTGRAFQGAFRIKKRIDKATPLMFQAVSQNQEIELTIELWRDKPKGGGRENFFTIALQKGRCTSIRPEADPNDNDGSNPYVEHLSFVGEIVRLTYVDGGIEGEHNFRETQ